MVVNQPVASTLAGDQHLTTGRANSGFRARVDARHSVHEPIPMPTKTGMSEAGTQRRSPKPAVIHFVEVGKIGTELRPVCGAWSEYVTWTTVRAVMTCPACERLLRVPHPEHVVP